MEYGGGSYYDDVVILLGTGLRVSELYGLTKAILTLTVAGFMCGGSSPERQTSPMFYQQSQDQERYSHHSHDRHGVYGP